MGTGPGEVHLSPVHIRVRARAPTRNKRTSPDVRQATLIEIQTNEMTSSQRWLREFGQSAKWSARGLSQR